MRLAIPRRVFSNSHLDYVAEVLEPRVAEPIQQNPGDLCLWKLKGEARHEAAPAPEAL